MNESDRAACYAAEYELQTSVPPDFDLDALEVVYLDDNAAGAHMLATASGLSEDEAADLLRRCYY